MGEGLSIREVAGLFLFFVGWILLQKAAFRASSRWGYLIGFIPFFAAPFFARRHWDDAKWVLPLVYGGALLFWFGG